MFKTDRNQSDYQLVKEIINGQKEKYRILVDRYAPMVFHVVRSFIKNENEVEELAQQVFVKAFEKLKSLNKQSKFSSWLYSLSLNHCRDYIKNVRRRNERFSYMGDKFFGE